MPRTLPENSRFVPVGLEAPDPEAERRAWAAERIAGTIIGRGGRTKRYSFCTLTPNGTMYAKIGRDELVGLIFRELQRMQFTIKEVGRG